MQYEQFNAGQRKLNTANIKNHMSQNKIVFNILLKIYCKKQIKIPLFFQPFLDLLSTKMEVLVLSTVWQDSVFVTQSWQEEPHKWYKEETDNNKTNLKQNWIISHSVLFVRIMSYYRSITKFIAPLFSKFASLFFLNVTHFICHFFVQIHTCIVQKFFV